MTLFACMFAACAASASCAYGTALVVQGRVASLRARMRPLTLEEVMRDRVLCFTLFAAAAAVAAWAVSPLLLPPALALAAVLARKAPAFLDERQRRALCSACDGDLDVLADIVAMGVRAGLSFDAALELYCAKFDCVLSCEMAPTLAQWRSGIATRAQALEGLAQRTGSRALKRFGDMALQSIEHGAPMSDMLARFAVELREERAASVERQVERAPVKMLLPLGLCILPAMLVLVMGPVMLQFLGSV